MDRLRELLVQIKLEGRAKGNFLGLLNVLIGSRIETPQGELISGGATWRELAEALKRVRWDKQSADELSLDRARLAPRDRQKFWYQVIGLANVDSAQARAAGVLFAETLRQAGIHVK
jgi:hypothetical protein